MTKLDKGDPSRFPVCSDLSVSTPEIRSEILGLLRRSKDVSTSDEWISTVFSLLRVVVTR